MSQFESVAFQIPKIVVTGLGSLMAPKAGE